MSYARVDAAAAEVRGIDQRGTSGSTFVTKPSDRRRRRSPGRRRLWLGSWWSSYLRSRRLPEDVHGDGEPSSLPLPPRYVE